jgi:hypothetical protein
VRHKRASYRILVLTSFSAMFSGFLQQTLLAALVTSAHANIMVESVDGSFIPWHFQPRASTNNGSGLAVRLTNYNDTAYLVSLKHSLVQVTNLVVGYGHYGWVI